MPVGGMHMHGRRPRRGGHQGGRRHPVRHGRQLDPARAPTAGSPASSVEGGRARRRRRRRVQRRPAGGIPRVARRPRGAAGGARAAGTRRRACCGSPASAACRRRTPPTTTSTSAPTGTASFRALIHDGVRMPDPSILVTLHSLDDRTLAPPAARRLYVLEPTPNLANGRIDWASERGRIVEDLRRRTSVARVSHRRRRRGGVRPDRLGTHGHGTRHPVRTRPHVPPDRAVPARTTSTAGRPGSCSRVRRRCPASACPMVLVSGKLAARARRRVRRSETRLDGAGSPCGCRSDTDHAAAAEWSPTLDESYALCREFNKRHGTTYYWSTKVLPKVKRHHVHALYAFCRVRRRHRRRDAVTGRPRRVHRRARRRARRLRRPLLRRSRARDGPTTRC